MAVVDAAGLLWFLLLSGLSYGDQSPRVLTSPRVCPLDSIQDVIFSFLQNDVCRTAGAKFSHSASVIEGNEVMLQKAHNIIHENKHDSVALLFYSSWCCFSGPFRPSFSLLSSIFPSIPHFAIEELAVRPSILTKYGVHGFPSLILLNSTMCMKYQGSRTLDSLISFYNEFTGIKLPADAMLFNKTEEGHGCDEKHKSSQETCPFPWARSPQNLFQQEMYLALATIFVVLRLLYFTFPTLWRCAQLAWWICTTSGCPVVHLTRVLQFFNSLKELCKQRNLQEGAKNAKAWASKSLASVTITDTGSSHNTSVSHVH